MLASGFITVVLNRVTRRLWLSPLIVNAVSILILLSAASFGWIAQKDATYAMYFNYMPIVFGSIMVNLSIGIFRVLDRKFKEKVWGYESTPGRGRK